MKKVWALITALALMLALAVGASAAVPKKPGEFAKAMVSTTLVEIYALLAFLVSLLSTINIGNLAI